MWVDLEQKSPFVDHWPSDKEFRVSVALIFAPDSAPRRNWIATLQKESDSLAAVADQ
jgi:hypothetical protein